MRVWIVKLGVGGIQLGFGCEIGGLRVKLEFGCQNNGFTGGNEGLEG